MSKFTIQGLVSNIANAVQSEAAKIPGLENGAIRILFVAKCKAAVNYLGFGPQCEIDFGYPIKEGASHTIPAKKDQAECDCYGYAALKIGGCSYAVRNNLGRRSCDMPVSAETYGRTNDRGCVVYDVLITEVSGIADKQKPKLYFRIYIAVSGATSEEDEQCALAAGDILRSWCKESNDDGFNHVDHYLDLVEPE